MTLLLFEGFVLIFRTSGQDWKVDPSQGHLQISSHPFLLVRFTRREFAGMIHFITSNVIIPATPRNPFIPYG